MPRWSACGLLTHPDCFADNKLLSCNPLHPTPPSERDIGHAACVRVQLRRVNWKSDLKNRVDDNGNYNDGRFQRLNNCDLSRRFNQTGYRTPEAVETLETVHGRRHTGGLRGPIRSDDPGDSIRFTKNNDGVAELAVDVSAELSADGEPTSVNGTVTASDNGAGTAQLGVEITRNGSAQETRLTIFVEADLGYAAFGDASESTTRRTLADGLLEANAINQEPTPNESQRSKAQLADTATSPTSLHRHPTSGGESLGSVPSRA